MSSAYARIRDIILSRDLERPELLAPQLRALYEAAEELRLGTTAVERAGEYWKVRGSKQGTDEQGRTLYVWHMATPHTCTCASFYDIPGTSITCRHRMVAWLSMIGGPA
jgi:hypothetical protein